MIRAGRIVAGGLAVGFAAAVVTGRANLLVRPWFTWPLAATAVLLAAAAATRIDHRVSRGAAVALLMPLAVGVTLTPSLATRATQASSLSTLPAQRIGDRSNPLVGGGGGPVTLLQILQAERAVGGVLLAGRPVQLDAMIAGTHRLERSAIVCCAADAQRLAIDVQGAALSPSGHWVRVTGRLRAVGNRTVIEATSVRPIPTPADPFL